MDRRGPPTTHVVVDLFCLFCPRSHCSCLGGRLRTSHDAPNAEKRLEQSRSPRPKQLQQQILLYSFPLPFPCVCCVCCGGRASLPVSLLGVRRSCVDFGVDFASIFCGGASILRRFLRRFFVGVRRSCVDFFGGTKPCKTHTFLGAENRCKIDAGSMRAPRAPGGGTPHTPPRAPWTPPPSGGSLPSARRPPRRPP